VPKYTDPTQIPGFVGGEFESYYPSGALVRSGIPVLEGIARGQFVEGTTRGASDMGSQMWTNIALTDGVPYYRIEALGEIWRVSAQLQRAIGVDWDTLGESLAGPAMQTLGRSLETIGSGIPWLRWGVALGRSLYSIARLIQGDAQRRPPEELPSDALLYDRDRDQDTVRAILKRTSREDWTDLFMPPHVTGMDFDIDPVEWRYRGLQDGLNVTFGGQSTGGFGFVPGLARIDGSWLQAKDLGHDGPGSAWYEPEGLQRQAKGPRDTWYQFTAPPTYTDTLADILPATTQLGTLLWATATRNGPSAFRINPDRIADGWATLYERQWRAGLGYATVGQKNRRFMGYALGYNATWAFAGRSRLEGISFSDVPSRYRSPPYTVDQIVLWQLRDVWERRILAALNTITVAYVDETSPTLRWAKTSRPEIFRRWETNRRRLLLHEARHLVDLGMVPDRGYRGELERSRRLGATEAAQATEADADPQGRAKVDLVAKAPKWEGEPLVVVAREAAPPEGPPLEPPTTPALVPQTSGPVVPPPSEDPDEAESRVSGDWLGELVDAIERLFRQLLG
jgi:hypothetical protein